MRLTCIINAISIDEFSHCLFSLNFHIFCSYILPFRPYLFVFVLFLFSFILSDSLFFSSFFPHRYLMLQMKGSRNSDYVKKVSLSLLLFKSRIPHKDYRSGLFITMRKTNFSCHLKKKRTNLWKCWDRGQSITPKIYLITSISPEIFSTFRNLICKLRSTVWRESATMKPLLVVDYVFHHSSIEFRVSFLDQMTFAYQLHYRLIR